MASVANCIGGACSPFVVQMTRVNAILPFAFMGGLSFVAAFFCWFLPETLGKKTPEVMEDAGVKQGRHIPLLELHLLPEKAHFGLQYGCNEKKENQSKREMFGDRKHHQKLFGDQTFNRLATTWFGAV